MSISDGLEYSNLLFVVDIKVSEPSRIRKQVCLILVQLDVRHEPAITDVFGECLFKSLNPLVGHVAQFFGLGQPRKISMDGVQVNHRRKEYVITLLLREKP